MPKKTVSDSWLPLDLPAPMSHLSQWRGRVNGMAVSFLEEVRPLRPRAEYASGLSQQALNELRNRGTR